MEILVKKWGLPPVGNESKPVVGKNGRKNGWTLTRGDRISGRADREKVQHHQFGVCIPARREEAVFWRPALRKSHASVEHPRPVHALIDLRGKVLNLRILKVLPAGQNPTEQNCRVDGRDLGIKSPLTGIHIHKVVIKSGYVM